MKSSLLSLALIGLCSWLGWTAYEETKRPIPSVASRELPAKSGAPEGQRTPINQKPSIIFPSLETLDEIVSRPLFNISRRPVIVEKITPVIAPTDLNVMLSGIVIGETRQIAHLRSLTDKQTLALSVGDKIGSWEIESIFPDHVVLRSGGRVETLFMQKPGVKSSPGRSTKASGSRAAPQRARSRAQRRTRRNLRRPKPSGER